MRMAMLRLARRLPAQEAADPQPALVGGLRQEWEQPMHWTGLLAMGASTRLPRQCRRTGRRAPKAEQALQAAGRFSDDIE